MVTAGTARAEDQVRIVTVLRDLVAVAVMQDRLEPDDARALAGPGLQLLASRLGVLDDPGLADLATPVDETRRRSWVRPPRRSGPPRRPRPVSLTGRHADEDYCPPGTRAMRRGSSPSSRSSASSSRRPGV